MDSRSKNGTRNIAAGFINRFIMMILPFVSRTVIIYTLGSQYLGLSGLFTSILTVLNLSELGFGSALVYSMYKPVAENDRIKICAYLSLYKRIYRWIGLFILIGGLLFSPFLPVIIKKDLPDDINVYIIYFIFLANASISYFAYAHKKALLTAFQRSDVLSNVNSVINIASHSLQIILLLIIPNYYLYVIILPIFTVLDNIWTNYVTTKRYPDIKPSGVLTKVEIEEIKRHVKGIALQKACSTSRNTFANIIISMFLGLTTIAMYGNYYYIMNSIHAFLYQIPNSIRATVGNSIASESVDKNYKNFKSMYLVYMWISGWCTCCLVCLYQPFMRLWMGEKLMFPMSTVILLCLYFCLLCLSDIIALYKDGAGLWWQGRYRVVVEAVSNLLLSFVLGWLWGVNGILIAPIITITFVGHVYGGYIIFHFYFKGKSFLNFLANQVGLLFIIAIVSTISYLFFHFFPINGIITFAINTLFLLVVSNVLFWMLFRLHPHYSDSVNFVVNIVRSVKKVRNEKNICNCTYI